MPTEMDDYLFDLQGYLVLKNAVSASLLTELNNAFDAFPALECGEWWGNSQRRDYTEETGFELHNCIEAGGPFETLIDHPAWIFHLQRYCGEKDSYVEGLFIDECIASIRKTGGHHPVHSGGYRGALRGAFGYKNGVFRCGQCNIILTLGDIAEGDGPTMVIPGSHKSNLPHPMQGDYAKGERMDHLPGAIPVYMKAGDALLFVDGLMHGGSSRNNEGERRVIIYRYGPIWAKTRFGYEYSQELLNRLTPERRILDPVPPTRPPV